MKCRYGFVANSSSTDYLLSGGYDGDDVCEEYDYDDNTHANRRTLAKYMVRNCLESEDMVRYAVKGLACAYLEDDDLFRQDWAEMNGGKGESS
jgi:hypothetical protein